MMPAPAAGPDVAAAFAELAETLASDLVIDTYLVAVCRHCVRLVGSESAAILYAAGDDDSVSAAASDDRGLMLALGGPGTPDGVRPPDDPWTDCKETGQLIAIADVAAKIDRWPWFAKSAVQAGFTTITLVPVSSPDGVLGALALLGGQPPDVAGILLALSLADAAGAGLAVSREHRRQQDAITELQSALTSRIVIEQAKGILAERWKITPDEAFGHLRRHARSSQQGLPDIARGVIAGSCHLTRPDPVARA
jgi:GAF domain-containing protein